MPRQHIVIEFDADYYGALGLNRNNLFPGKTLFEKQQNAKMIHGAYLSQAALWHPDRHWTGDSPEPTRHERTEMFKKIVKSHSVLSDQTLKQIYDKGESAVNEDDSANPICEINWNEVGCFQNDSVENTIGSIVFRTMCDMLGNMVTGVLEPEDENFHNYVWEMYLDGRSQISPLTLSVVHDEEEVLRLTSSDKVEASLPFKLYIFFPSNKSSLIFQDDATAGEQTIVGLRHEDVDLYEGTNFEDVLVYVKNKMIEDINTTLAGGTLE